MNSIGVLLAALVCARYGNRMHIPDGDKSAPTQRQAVTSSVLGRGAQAGAPKAKAKAPGSAKARPSYPRTSIGAAGATATTQSSMGPATAYQRVAAGAMGDIKGPGAVAAGRAMQAGGSIMTGGGMSRASISKMYQIVFVTGEVAPFSKTGGLGEAMDGLPAALAALGHRVMVIAPRYDQYEDACDTDFSGSLKMGRKQEPVHFFHTYQQKVDYVFLDHPTFLERVNGMSGAKLFGPEWGKDFGDNQARFAFFCKAALIAIHDLKLGASAYGDMVVVVANDWHSALVPMFIRAEREANPSKWRKTKTVLLVHNAAFQGRFEKEHDLASVFGVPQHYIDSVTLKMPLKVGKYNGKVSCVNTMAAGLRYADRVLTVSPTYAREVSSDPEKSVELEKYFTKGKVTGILNGVKEVVSPMDEEFVKKTKMLETYGAENASAAKQRLKDAYREESGLVESKGPMISFIGRLDAQKGYDLLLEALEVVLEDTELQIVIAGAGRTDLVRKTKVLEKKYPSKIFYAGWMGPERYAMLAACDYTLLPSRWEPCGLVQMEAMRLGTLPIVAPTGGLKDTVVDGVNGLWTDGEMSVESEIDPKSVRAIAKALRRAAKLHTGSPAKEDTMKRAAMAAAAEFTWNNSALQYEKLFKEMGVVGVDMPVKSVTLEKE